MLVVRKHSRGYEMSVTVPIKTAARDLDKYGQMYASYWIPR
jgi:hypothetical protein